MINVNFSNVIKAFIWNLNENKIKSNKIEDIIYKTIYKADKKRLLLNIHPRICFNGNDIFPYSQAICDILYEIRVCGQDMDSDFSYILNYLTNDEINLLTKLNRLV